MIVVRGVNLLDLLFFVRISRVRRLQDLQVARHPPEQGEPSVLYHLRVVWFP